MINQYYAVIDTETGGLPKELQKKAFYEVALKEIACVIVSGLKMEIVDKKSWLVRPYLDNLIYSEEAAEISNISREDCVNKGLPHSVVCKELCQLLKRYKSNFLLPQLVGHNVSFDMDFFSGLMQFNKIDPMKFIDKTLWDTQQLMKMCNPYAPKFKLATCCNFFSIPLFNAHNALPDTIATAQLFLEMMKKIRTQKTEMGFNDQETREQVRQKLW